MSQTITSSDLIPNENIMSNEMELFSCSTFLLPVKLLHHALQTHHWWHCIPSALE